MLLIRLRDRVKHGGADIHDNEFRGVDVFFLGGGKCRDFVGVNALLIIDTGDYRR